MARHLPPHVIEVPFLPLREDSSATIRGKFGRKRRVIEQCAQHLPQATGLGIEEQGVMRRRAASPKWPIPEARAQGRRSTAPRG